jgi:dienelactone hydrolase
MAHSADYSIPEPYMRMTLRMFYCVLPVVCLTLSSPVMAAQSLKLLRADRQQIPAQAYLPDAACKGVAVISHGAGGSEKGYAYLGEALAARGWLAVVPAHQESGTRVLGRSLLRHKPNEALTQMVTDSAAYRSRLEEIGLAKDWARQRCAQGEAVLLGHSMGAATTMIEAGAENLVGVRGERRFDRYVAMSPQGIRADFSGTCLVCHTSAGTDADRYPRRGTGRPVLAKPDRSFYGNAARL